MSFLDFEFKNFLKSDNSMYLEKFQKLLRTNLQYLMSFDQGIIFKKLSLIY